MPKLRIQLPTKLRGFAASALFVAVGCVSAAAVVDPFPCERFFTDDARLDEYAALSLLGYAPATRAWIREADRTCAANQALRGESEPQPEYPLEPDLEDEAIYDLLLPPPTSSSPDIDPFIEGLIPEPRKGEWDGSL